MKFVRIGIAVICLFIVPAMASDKPACRLSAAGFTRVLYSQDLSTAVRYQVGFKDDQFLQYPLHGVTVFGCDKCLGADYIRGQYGFSESPGVRAYSPVTTPSSAAERIERGAERFRYQTLSGDALSDGCGVINLVVLTNAPEHMLRPMTSALLANMRIEKSVGDYVGPLLDEEDQSRFFESEKIRVENASPICGLGLLSDPLCK